MDLAVFIRVLWRFKLLLALGLVLATAIALLSVARVGLGSGGPEISYRTQQQWLSSSTIFVTQDGFPWGRAILDEMVRVETPGQEPTYVPRFGDPGRYSGLAALYAELAKSDAVRQEVLLGSTPGQWYDAQVVQSGQSGALPLIYMVGYGPTPAAAVDVANRATAAFSRFIEGEQSRNAIPADKRVEVVVTQEAAGAQVHQGRSPARPVFLFLLVFMFFVALSFVLENLRPRPRPAELVPAARPAPVRRAA